MSTPTNGWSRYEELVFHRLRALEAGAKEDRERAEKEREKAEERHRCLMRKFDELKDDFVEFKAGRRLQWFKVAGIALAVSAAATKGRDIWEALLRWIL